MEQRRLVPVGMLLALLWLGACGQASTGVGPADGEPASSPPQPDEQSLLAPKRRQTKRLPKEALQRPATSANGDAPVTVSPPPRPESAATVASRLLATINAAAGYNALVAKSERHRQDGSYKATRTSVLSKRGDRVLIEALAHYKPSNVGARIGYRVGSEVVTVRPGGFLSFLTKDFSIADAEMLSPAGYRLDQFDFYTIAERLADPGYDFRLAGETELAGRRLPLLEVTAPRTTNAMDPEIQLERFAYDPHDSRIIAWEAYKTDRRPVLRVVIEAFHPLQQVDPAQLKP